MTAVFHSLIFFARFPSSSLFISTLVIRFHEKEFFRFVFPDSCFVSFRRNIKLDFSRESSTRFSALSWVHPKTSIRAVYIQIYAACPCTCCMSQYMLLVHNQGACQFLCCMSMPCCIYLHFRAERTWTGSIDMACSMDMDMPHEHGMQHWHDHAAWTCPCCVVMSMLRGHVHAACPRHM